MIQIWLERIANEILRQLDVELIIIKIVFLSVLKLYVDIFTLIVR